MLQAYELQLISLLQDSGHVASFHIIVNIWQRMNTAVAVNYDHWKMFYIK